MTLPRRQRHARAQGLVVGVRVATDASGGPVLRAEIMRVEAAPLTVTF